MFTKRIFLLTIIISFFLTSCYKDDDETTPPDDSVPESMDELDVPQNFDWKTTKTINVQVDLPNNGDPSPLIITNRQVTKRYFKGFPEDNSRTVNTKITIPTYLSELRLFYNGTNGPNMAVIEGEYLSYNFNAMQKSLKAVSDEDCDLSGFVTYSKGGWQGGSGNNGGGNNGGGNNGGGNNGGGNNGGGNNSGGNNSGGAAYTLLTDHFDDVYSGNMVIGDPGNYTITFTGANEVADYLPGNGQPQNSGALNSSYTNPTNNLGNMASQIIAARLNVDFDAAGYLGSDTDYELGELVFKDGPFQNTTVNDFLDMAEIALGGGGLNVYSVEQYKTYAEYINLTFDEDENVDALTCPNDEEEEEDYPFIEISSNCSEPDGIFTITNTGEEEMDDSEEYRVYRNGTQIETGSYELDINESTDIVITFNAPDDVIRVEADMPEDAENEDDMIYSELTDCGEVDDDDDDETTTEQLEGTLAYEDLWPGKGDYDFNDLVIDYDLNVQKNNQEVVQSITAVFEINAFGASQHNGFGFSLPNVNPSDITSVSGYDIQYTSVFDLRPNGVENGQSNATFIVFDDVRRVMPQTTAGIGVNTQVEYDYIDPVTMTLEIEFQDNAMTYSELDIGTFDPFIVVNSVDDGEPGIRGREVHLPGYEPTDLFDESLFGSQEDDSNPSEDKYFVTENNLPWAINIAEEFDWVVEFQDITGAYNHFYQWAESNGTVYPDWYQDKTGYRNDNLIYPTQKGIN